MVENAAFPYKTALSIANFKTNRKETLKWVFFVKDIYLESVLQPFYWIRCGLKNVYIYFYVYFYILFLYFLFMYIHT